MILGGFRPPKKQNRRNMKIAIHSDPHISLSGYGVQTKYLTDYIKTLGHSVVCVPKCGLIMTHAIEMEGYHYYPPMGQWGNEGVNALQKKWQPDLLISNLDPWITDYQKTKNWIAWSPIDHDPIPPDQLKKLKSCLLPVALTRFSEKQMIESGLDPMYCPYGVDTKILYPDKEKRNKFRNAIGLCDTDYLIGMVGVNQFERKGYSQAFRAYKLFKDKHPNAYLYVHADPFDVNGMDLFEMANSIGIEVIFPDAFMYREGFDTSDLSYVYNAFDVYLTTTHGEGFGIPIIEAQACGIPVIATDFMGIPELNPYGETIKTQPEFTPHKSWTSTPIIEDVIRCLEVAYTKEYDTEKIVEFAKEYDYDNIYKYWDAILARATNLWSMYSHEHKWCMIGNNLNTEIQVPCLIDGCECGLVVTEDKPNEIRFGLYKPEHNGVKFDIEDDPDSGVAKVIIKEIPLNQLEEIGLNEKSFVVDIGAQVGVISTYIAKKFGSHVMAIEPMPDNYSRLVRNINAMGVGNLVNPVNKSVYNGKPIKLSRGETNLTGSARVSDEGIEVESVNLHDIIKCVSVIDCLKIDCEGSEYEILYNLSEKDFRKIKHIRGEFHYIEGQDPNKLLEHCKKFVPDTKVVFSELTK